MLDTEEKILGVIDDRLSFVLEHPGMSDWLKQTLTSGLHRDPIEVVNDLEILDTTLRSRAKVLTAVRVKSRISEQ